MNPPIAEAGLGVIADAMMAVGIMATIPLVSYAPIAGLYWFCFPSRRSRSLLALLLSPLVPWLIFETWVLLTLVTGGIEAAADSTLARTAVIVFYCSLVMPLIISAYLIVGKRRKPLANSPTANGV